MESILEKLCCAFCFKSKKKKNGRATQVGDVGISFVNRKSMKYKPSGNPCEEMATFGAGCYWGTEKWFITRF